MIECILQVLNQNLKNRVLVCAPSNAAADLLAQKLLAHLPTAAYRAYASTKVGTDDAALTSPDAPAYPTAKTIAPYRAVVSTCVNAAFALNIGLPPGYFSHIFVDEAATATEPETLTAGIRRLATSHGTRVVLAGDP